MVKNIIFDWSGVIRDSAESQLDVVNKILKKFGSREISMDEFRENWVQPYMLFYNKYLPSLTLEEEKAAYKELVSEYSETEPFVGIVDLIKEFKKKGIRMVILSSDFPETLLREIDDYGLKNIFDEVITDSHDKAEEIVDLMKNNSFLPNETIFLGDTNHEIEVGKKVGIMTGAVTWGFNTEKNLKAKNPDFIIHDLKELKTVILGN